MAWHVFEKLLEGVANYSTFIGKIWITFLFIFRIIMVASVGDTVYNDEQSAFVCNTLQPGCTNVCFNQFSPISQIRFWAVQILFVGTPSVVFIVFAMHKMSILSAESENNDDEKTSSSEKHSGKRRSVEFEDEKIRRRRNEERKTTSEKSVEERTSSGKTSLPQYEDVAMHDTNDKRSAHGIIAANGIIRNYGSKTTPSHNSKESIHIHEGNNRLAEIIVMPPTREKVKRKTVYNKDGKSEVVKTPSIARAYFAQAIIRTCVEVVFLVLQSQEERERYLTYKRVYGPLKRMYYMYDFEVHELYVCEGFPCPKQVDCFVSRPKEKTLFLQFMYAMTGLSLVLNLMELIQLIKNFCSRAFGKQEDKSLKRLFVAPREYMTSDSSHRRRHKPHFRQTYPELGPFPRTHDNSFTDTDDDNSIDSDYRFYD